MFSFLKKHVEGILSQQEFPFYQKYPPKLNLPLQDKIVNVSHKAQFVNFRIFKAANSTVVSSVYHAETGNVIESLVDIQLVKDTYYGKLSSLSQAQVKLVMDSYYKFTFVRNPFVRVLSAYLDKVIKNEAGKRDIIANFLNKPFGSEISFDEFISYLEMGGINQNAHWARQFDLLPIPLDKFDFIGKTENLSVDLPIVLYHIFKKDCKIIAVREHATNANDVLNTLDPETRKRIYNLYKIDFECFKY